VTGYASRVNCEFSRKIKTGVFVCERLLSMSDLMEMPDELGMVSPRSAFTF